MFADLRRQHGVRSYLAHDMTVTLANVDQVGEVVTGALPVGWSMLSFQPVAFVGDDRRWRGGDYTDVGIEAVWSRLEEALGRRGATRRPSVR